MAPLTVSYLIIALGLLISFSALGIGVAGHRRHRPCRDQPAALLRHHLSPARRASGEYRACGPRPRRQRLSRSLRRVTVPMIWPAMLAAFFLPSPCPGTNSSSPSCLSQFDVTMPVVIWSMLRTGLNPETNAVGTLVFADFDRPRCCWSNSLLRRGGGAMAEALVSLRGDLQELRDFRRRLAGRPGHCGRRVCRAAWGRPAAARRPAVA